MQLFVIVSSSSTLVTVILRLAVLFSGSARIVFMAAGESNHIRIQASLMLLALASISF